MDRSLGQKIDKKMQATLQRSAKRRAPLQEVKRGRTALSLDGIMIIVKDAHLLKILIFNEDQKNG
jgi:hypothetical protein